LAPPGGEVHSAGHHLRRARDAATGLADSICYAEVGLVSARLQVTGPPDPARIVMSDRAFSIIGCTPIFTSAVSTLDATLATTDRCGNRTLAASRKDMESLFAPLNHGALVAKTHAKSEQLADICS
jgi:hypothetical protein